MPLGVSPEEDGAHHQAEDLRRVVSLGQVFREAGVMREHAPAHLRPLLFTGGPGPLGHIGLTGDHSCGWADSPGLQRQPAEPEIFP